MPWKLKRKRIKLTKLLRKLLRPKKMLTLMHKKPKKLINRLRMKLLKLKKRLLVLKMLRIILQLTVGFCLLQSNTLSY